MKNRMKKCKISNNVIRRMPRYLRKLDELKEIGIIRISSAELGMELGLTPSQIRQDFSCFGEFGQQGYGYNVCYLRDSIASVLGMNRRYKVIIVGVGNIGRALIDNFCFSAWGLDLVAAFDKDVTDKEALHNGVPIYGVEEIHDFILRQHVDIAVLAVPGIVAKSVATNLSYLGIGAIWNFTNVDIADPHSEILVENMHFSDSLLALSYYVTEKNDVLAKKECCSQDIKQE